MINHLLFRLSATILLLAKNQRLNLKSTKWNWKKSGRWPTTSPFTRLTCLRRTVRDIRSPIPSSILIKGILISADLINAEALKRCKSTVRIINIARGGIVDEAALLDSLISDRCKGAALDVFVQEPPKEGTTTWQLIQHPRVVCTPHLGASTVEAQERVAREIAEQLIDLAEGRQAVGIANAPNLARSMVERNKPWMQLAQALGYLANSLAEGSLHRRPAEAETNVELICCGTKF